MSKINLLLTTDSGNGLNRVLPHDLYTDVHDNAIGSNHETKAQYGTTVTKNNKHHVFMPLESSLRVPPVMFFGSAASDAMVYARGAYVESMLVTLRYFVDGFFIRGDNISSTFTADNVAVLATRPGSNTLSGTYYWFGGGKSSALLGKPANNSASVQRGGRSYFDQCSGNLIESILPIYKDLVYVKLSPGTTAPGLMSDPVGVVTYSIVPRLNYHGAPDIIIDSIVGARGKQLAVNVSEVGYALPDQGA
jgi:hypothetical protein